MPTVGRASSIPVVAPRGRDLTVPHNPIYFLSRRLEARTERAGRRMATLVLEGRIPESASPYARAVAGRAARDAVSIDAVNATTADDSVAAAGQTLRPRRWRRNPSRHRVDAAAANGCSARHHLVQAPRTRTRRRRLPRPAERTRPASAAGPGSGGRTTVAGGSIEDSMLRVERTEGAVPDEGR